MFTISKNRSGVWTMFFMYSRVKRVGQDTERPYSV